MRVGLFQVAICLVACAMTVSCANKQKSRTEKLLEGEQDVDMYAHVTGINETSNVPVEGEQKTETPTAPPEEQPSENNDDVIGGSQGAFVGRLLMDGKDTKGTFTVQIATAGGEVIKKDVSTGSEIKLDPGTYDFVFKSDVVVGDPEFTLSSVEIPAGRRIKRNVKMQVGKITLVTGGQCAKKPIRIKPQGATEWYKGKFTTCVEIVLKAGNYEAEMGSEKNPTPISGIQVYDGGTRDILIRAQ